MPNVSRPFGFRPVYKLDSAPYNGAHRLYAHSASDATALFTGDLVNIDSTDGSTALTDVYAPGVPYVKATGSTITTTVYRGVVAGVVPQPEFSQSMTASLGLTYIVASTARYLWVVDDYTVVFEGEESGTNSYVSQTSNIINKLVDVTAAAGSTTTGISAYTLATTGATTNKPMRILRATQRPDNFISTASTTTPYFHWDFMFANSDLATLLVGL